MKRRSCVYAMNNLLESKVVRTVLWILGGVIVLFVAFGLGIAVGANRARFAAGFDDNYYHNFYGAQGGGGPMGSSMPPPLATHGIVGTVIDLESPLISVKDQANNEQSVQISSGTVIREGGDTIMIGDIMIGDQIAVIGDPNDQGQVVARFIRVFPAASSSSAGAQ
jgi:hypothetical protein